jgi:hypothetical protein
MKNVVFWDVEPCRSCVTRRFGGTSVYTRPTWRHIPEDGILQHPLCTRVRWCIWKGLINFYTYITNNWPQKLQLEHREFTTHLLEKMGRENYKEQEYEINSATSCVGRRSITGLPNMISLTSFKILWKMTNSEYYNYIGHCVKYIHYTRRFRSCIYSGFQAIDLDV